MKTIEELERLRRYKLAENKRRAEVMLGAEYVFDNWEVKCSNVESEHDAGNWMLNFYPAWDWSDNDYRLIPKPEMVDLDFEDVPDLLGQRCVCVRDYEYIVAGDKCVIDGYSTVSGVVIVKSEKYESRPLYQELRRHFTRPDGSKFEKEKK